MRCFNQALLASFVSVVPSFSYGQGGPTELIASAKSVPSIVKESRATLSTTKPHSGTVLLCGGGPIPHQIRENFHDRGKGDKGSLVVIPTASSIADLGDYTYWIDFWGAFRWGSLDIVHLQDRDAAMADEKAVRKLESATAVWIGGGDQSRLAERYLGTPIEAAIHSVLGRGGIVGGTSAGAAIASSLMISGGWNDPKLASGFPLLPKAIVDQHFTQKRRFERLARAVYSNPERTGIGVDESTGVFISREKAKVVGDGAVYVYRATSNPPSEPQADSHDPINTFLSIETARLLPGDEIDARDLDVFGH
ncbi:MAG: cyanophycinase [Planctomycetes bacterium]|nr:cyanophycinase [Planctomycetota bacterium]